LPPDIMVFPMQIEKVYEPQRFEPHWAQWWIDSGIFRASPENPGRAPSKPVHFAISSDRPPHR
jgi:valyl-tRNA synthetase